MQRHMVAFAFATLVILAAGCSTGGSVVPQVIPPPAGSGPTKAEESSTPPMLVVASADRKLSVRYGSYCWSEDVGTTIRQDTCQDVATETGADPPLPVTHGGSIDLSFEAPPDSVTVTEAIQGQLRAVRLNARGGIVPDGRGVHTYYVHAVFKQGSAEYTFHANAE